MIQPLRSLHYRTFAALALVLPAIVLVGIGARRRPTNSEARGADLPATAYLVRESNGLWAHTAMVSKFYGRSDRLRDIYVVLQPKEWLSQPDLLLYWSTEAPSGKSLPNQASFVGTFNSGEAFALPLEKGRSGHLVLFSLAHQAVFDAARVEALP